MRRFFLFGMAFLLLMVSAVWLIGGIRVMHWDGGQDLTITISSEHGIPRTVRWHPFWYREDAEKYVNEPWHLEYPNSIADPFDGKPLKVFLPISGREIFGIEYAVKRNHYLLISGVFENGQEFRRIVEIPDHRVSKEVSITLP